MSLVEFHHVSFSYGGDNVLFRDVSFNLTPGSFHYLTGASGAGKSSLIHLMYGGQPLQSKQSFLCTNSPSYTGKICVLGRDLKRVTRHDMTELRQKMGIVFQDFHLLDHLNILDNVAIPLRLTGQTWSKARKLSQTVLEWIGLENQMASFPKILSGGQRQRAVIARAIINRPKILIADEPTGNLDYHNALKLLSLFEELNKQGTTILFATHNRELLEAFPHPLLHLEEGLLTHHEASSFSSEGSADFPAQHPQKF